MGWTNEIYSSGEYAMETHLEKSSVNGLLTGFGKSTWTLKPMDKVFTELFIWEDVPDTITSKY